MSKIKLGDITKIRTGKLDANASSENGTYPFFTCSKDPLRINSYSYDCECVLVAGNGDLNVKYYKGKFDAYQRTYIIEDNSDGRLFIPYLYYFLELYVEELRKQSIGGVIKYIKLGNLTDAIIELPSIEKQKEIVNILNKSRKIVESKNALLQGYNQLIKSRFVEMFGYVNSNSYNLNQDKLSNHLNVLGGHAFDSKKYAEEGIPILRIGNINTGIFIPKELKYWEYDENLVRYQVKPGDLLITLTGTVGKDDYGNVCIIDDTFPIYYLNQRNAKLDVFDTMNPVYLKYLLADTEIKNRLTGISRGVRQANIANRDILNLYVPIPSIEMQNQFSTFVQQVDKLKFEVRKSLNETQMLFDSLMQEYFG